MNMKDTMPLVNPLDSQKAILNWIGSDELKEMYKDTLYGESPEFKMGVMWGAAMAGLIAASKPEVYRVSTRSREDLANEVEEKMTYMCGCLNCIEKIKMIILDNVVPYENQCSTCSMREECEKKLKESSEKKDDDPCDHCFSGSYRSCDGCGHNPATKNNEK